MGRDKLDIRRGKSRYFKGEQQEFIKLSRVNWKTGCCLYVSSTPFYGPKLCQETLH